MTKQNRNLKLFELINKVREAICKKTLITSTSNLFNEDIKFASFGKRALLTNKNLTVSASGGQDSIFLLLICYLLQTQFGLTSNLLSCNHFWQKNGFYAVLHLIKSAFVFYLPIMSFVPLHTVLSEQEARSWRHLVTDRVSAFYGSDECVNGHTQSDRIETILFNLIRGTGSRGFASLQWEREHSSFSYNNFYPTLKQLRRETHFC